VTALVVGLTVAVALLAVLVAGLLRANAEVMRTLHHMGADMSESGPTPVGLSVRPTPARPESTDVADLVGVTPAGDPISLAITGVRHDTLVAFLTSGCATCRGFWDAFRPGTLSVPGGARLVVVTRGPEGESPGTIANLAGSTLPVVMSTDAWERYDIPYSPYFVYVSGLAGRVVGEGVAAGWEEVRTLVANAVADGTTQPSVGRPRSRADRARDAAVDRALEETGITPGDPRLHPTKIDEGAAPA
jgi:hypothetical protein